MVKFLTHRPVAVTMAFLALMLIGIATTTNLPVSLMPDIDIPIISVRIYATDMPARQLENSIVKPIRNILKQVNHVEEMKSEARDGSAWIELRFQHGTSIDLASIEVNEKVDKAMNSLPSGFTRPEVVRASASDIPVFYLMVHRKQQNIQNSIEINNQGAGPNPSSRRNQGNFSPLRGDKGGLSLSNFTSQVIRKRLEQLPEVALVDMNGLQYPEIKIFPDKAYIQSGAFSVAHLETALSENNIDLGNLLIRDGQYQYNIRFNTRLRDVDDISNIPVNLSGKIVPLSQVAEIKEQPQQPQGNVKLNGNPAISLAVIKQSDAKMATLEKALDNLVQHFKNDYPDLEFTITRDQTRLLRYSINNLGQSLLIGGLLAFLVLFLFLRERKAPWLMGISIPVSLIIALLFFYLAGLSINIISLSGLVLGVGMMIDNSIIVIDNIMQHRQKHARLAKACVDGTNEVIRPLISSVLTTCAVFIPLIFMKGMAGALFFDQAIAVSIGLTVSLIVSITLLPVLFRVFYQKNKNIKGTSTIPVYFNWYEKGLKLVLRNQFVVLLIILFMMASTVVMWKYMPLSRFPRVSQTETIVQIDWNEPVTLAENNHRIAKIMEKIKTTSEYIIEEAGRKQYLLNNTEESGITENQLIIKTRSPELLSTISNELSSSIGKAYPEADFHFSEAENLFNLAFGKEQPPLIARFTHVHPGGDKYIASLDKLQREIMKTFPHKIESRLITRQLILLETDPEKLLVYQINNNELLRVIKSAFDVNTVFTINDNNIFIPVRIGDSYQSVYQIIQNSMIRNRNDEFIPLSGLIHVSQGADLKTIVAGKENEYFPVHLNISNAEYNDATTQLKEIAAQDNTFDVNFGGSILSNKSMLGELLVIILISLLLLYFILAAQFESFWLPVIVLLEVPIDIFGAFLFLMVFGQGINIMSAIGIIVMTGIIINDSILKVDTINKELARGSSLLKSIFIGGRRRLKPIIMTSVTTILAMTPFLFQKGMGAELQKPLALAVIGGMAIGTLVSLYIIPLLYYLIKQKKI